MRCVGGSFFKQLFILFLFASVTVLVIAETKPSAIEKYAGFRSEFGKAYKAKDYRAARDVLRQLYAFAPGRPSTVYRLACVNALLGEKEEALRWLDLFARMGQVADLVNEKDLASLADSPEFKKIVVSSSKPATSDSSQLFATLPGARLVEDIAYDSQTHDFFFTSLLDKKILRVGTDKKVTVAVDLSSDPGWPLFAIGEQPAKRPLLWVTAAAMPDFEASPAKDSGKTVLLKIDAGSGRILARISPPDDGRPHVLGDMAIASDGTIVVSDGLGGAVYLLKGGETELRRIDANEFISPQTPAFSGDRKCVFVADYLRGIARIDFHSGSVVWLKSPDDVATTGVDGMYLRGDHLVAVQNGTAPERIVSFRLNADMTRIEGVESPVASGGAVRDVNHGVFIGTQLYYIANAGWNLLDDHGHAKPEAKQDPPTVRILNSPQKDAMK